MKKTDLRTFISTWAFPALLGGATVFGFAPFYLFPIPILALALFYRGLNGRSPRDGFLRGFAFGLGWFLASVSWVYISMHDVGEMSLPLAGLATFLFASVLAVFPALACGLAVRRPMAGGVHALFWFPALWALAEWLRGWVFTGLPWQALGYSQVPYGPLSGYAPILGIYGVSWLAAMTAVGIARWRVWPMALVVAIWAAGLGLQKVEWTRPVGKPLSVSLLQGNIPQDLKFRPEALAATLSLYAKLVADSESRLTVLPETALPLFRAELAPDYLQHLKDHAVAQGGDLLFGVPDQDADGRYYNSVVSTGVSPTQTYRKVHLVPFGEFVPFGFRWLVDAMKVPLSDFSRGKPDQPPLNVAGQRVAMNVCYEDVFGEELIDALPQATLMANVSNDAWFGDSFAPWQHLQIAQMRALETGRWWLKDNNTGITAVLNEKGVVVARLAPFTTGILNSEAWGMTGATPYVRWGNRAFLVLAAVSLLAAFGLGRRAR
ncbi:MAG: apolipoprotein N-acyltransferase [Parasulfuritortus sp.]|nr:apolipoprotein N-acyltransferase [Parasulfuritortus sp.]